MAQPRRHLKHADAPSGPLPARVNHATSRAHFGHSTQKGRAPSPFAFCAPVRGRRPWPSFNDRKWPCFKDRSQEYPTEIQRTDGAANVESYLYTRVVGSDYAPRLTSVLLRRSADGGVTWTNVRQTLYTYYDGTTAFGSLGDLATAEVQSWQDGAWASLGTTLYRYWLAPAASSSSSSSSGSSHSSSSSHASSSSSSSSSSSGATPLSPVHMLKYIVEPDSYARLAANPSAGGSPLTAPDWVVALYADNYFEYDNQRRVTLESVEGGSRTYTYAYTSGSRPICETGAAVIGVFG